ncbi:MAG: bifunctional shikimate kinase/3-dehydroquinate synthase [Chloroflexota bacterium]
MSVVLTGFMGTGKTSVGVALARRLGVRFHDTDQLVEAAAGRSIPQIFAEEGEKEFRRLESEAFRKALAGPAAVIATGGGTLLTEETRALLNGDQVFTLICEPAELRRRLGGQGDRPLLDLTPGRLERLLDQRQSGYKQFRQIDTTGRSPDEIAEQLVAIAGAGEPAELVFDRRQSSVLEFGPGLLQRLGMMVKGGPPGAIVLLTDRNVESAGWLDLAHRSVRDAGLEAETVVLEPGEHEKSIESLTLLYQTCLDAGLDRQSTVVGLGGGVIGDLAGMLAATYYRGVRLVLVPSTLLAQVDASIGGKVGIDFGGKNLVGSFYPADVVLADPNLLATLPVIELRNGLVEMAKIAALRSADLLAGLEGLERPEAVLTKPDLPRRAARLKAQLVALDPFEEGDRALLNFGHTVGHALESAGDFGLSHGEAVAIGMLAEARLAVKLGWAEHEVLERLTALLANLGCAAAAPDLDAAEVLDHMQRDKKRYDGRIRIAFPRRVEDGCMRAISEAEAEEMVGYALGGSS